jgi:hypothetical protein
MRELQVVLRGRTSVGGTDDTVPNSRHVKQFKVVDLI